MASSAPAEPVVSPPAASTSETVEALVETSSLETNKPTDATAPTEGETPELSKNQRKKLARQKRFEETRVAWKAVKKEKEKARKIKKREEKAVAAAAAAAAATVTDTTITPAASVGEKRKLPGDDDAEVEEAKRAKTKGEAHVAKVVEDITLIMDCGFDDLMTNKEVISMSSQLTRCYSANKASHRQFKMHVTSLNKRLLARYEGILQNQHLKWKGMTFFSEPYPVTPEEKESLVYLTADSENTIHELEPGKKYIIGGIVDRNRHKCLCFNKANEQGIAHGRLPIGEYVRMASRQVLTTNQVVEIMLEWLKERDWEKAFVKVIPQRKMWKLKGKEEGGDEREGKSDEVGDEGEEKGGEAGDENVKVEEGDVMVKAENMDVDPSESTGGASAMMDGFMKNIVVS